MLPTRLMLTGATSLAAGMMVISLTIGLAFSSGMQRAEAGGAIPCDATSTPTSTATATPDPTSTQIIVGRIQILGQIPTCTPIPSPTEDDDDEPNPTRTRTPAPTATNAPSTNTPVPATNTPTGGAGAGGVTPPNTGTGDAQPASGAYAILAIGALLALAGAGSLAAGVRRRS